MPIRLKSQTVYLGNLAVTLEDTTADIDGTVTVTPTVTGSVAVQLQPFTSAIVGSYAGSSVFTGTIAVTLDDVAGLLVDASVYLVFPLSTPISVFDFWDGVTLGSSGTPLPVITNPTAVWRVTAQNPLDGLWLFRNGGAAQYIKGTQTGVTSFTYEVLDYDGLGSDRSDIATLTVL